MFHAGDTIENPITGERIVFLQTAAETNGELVVVETFVQAGGSVAAHVRTPARKSGSALRHAVSAGKEEPRSRPGRPRRPSPRARLTSSERRQRGGALRLRGEACPALRVAAGDDVRARRARQDEPERAAQPTPTGRDRTRIRRYGPAPVPTGDPSGSGWLASPLGRLLGYEPLYTPPFTATSSAPQLA